MADSDRGARSTGSNEIEFKGHRAHVGVFIVGIDPQKFDDALKDEAVIKRIQELDDEYKDKIVVIGVDRLDYSKVWCRSCRDSRSIKRRTWS